MYPKSKQMGYTHYWKINRKKITPEEFNVAVEEIKKIYANLPKRTNTAGGVYKNHHLVIKGCDGTNKPIFDEWVIGFNGNRKNGTDHESFYIDIMDLNPWDFCKTARKPYDLLVCCSLIALANNLPEKHFSFSSDGNPSDWKPAIDLYNEIIGAIKPHVQKMLERL